METRSKTAKLFLSIIPYISSHRWMSGVALYFIISLVLKLAFSIDVLVPCLWKTIFHFDCPGCGLTTSMLRLLQLDIHGAYQSNPLIFLVLPAGLLYICVDFLKFEKNLHTSDV